mgnify:CR=1 FL=1
MRQVFPFLNRWRTFSFEEKRDGFAAELKVCLVCEEGKINLIQGIEIGTKTIDDKQIILDDLMSNNYLDLYKGTYGILIPSNELLNRLNFGWFFRMSPKQVLESDTIIGNYSLTAADGSASAVQGDTLIINISLFTNISKIFIKIVNS